MTITKITTYEDDAVEEVGSKLSELPELVAFLHAYAGSVQGVEDDGWATLTEGLFDVANCEGVQLNRIGEIIGQPRWDLTDADYRKTLRARVTANISKGTPEGLLLVLTELLGDRVYTYNRVVTGYAEISWQIAPYSGEQTELNVVALIQDAKPVGCTIALSEEDTSITPPFIFGSTGEGWGEMALATRRLL